MSKDDKARKPKAVSTEKSSMGPMVHESVAAGDKTVATPKKRKTLRLPKTVAAEREAQEAEKNRRKRVTREE